ncbi:isocitrate lyase/PEP mutase family protein [Gordonia sp. NPDC003424]
MAKFLGTRRHPRERLRALLGTGEPLLAPGAFDGLSARLAEQAGFEAVYMTGFGVAASLLGRPDVGLVTGSEMAEAARRIAAGVDLPVIADADTGYGNPLNVIRTVHDYEAAGIAAIQLEDQVAPKKCGHMAGKEVVAPGEMIAKIEAAAAARSDPDLLIIARTDAIAVHGIDDAIERAHRYAGAGADLLFVEAPTTVEQVRQVASELRGHRLVYNWVEGGRSPELSREELADLGFALILFPIGGLLAAARAMSDFYAQVRLDGTPAAALGDLPAFDEFTGMMGLDEIVRLSERFGPH